MKILILNCRGAEASPSPSLGVDAWGPAAPSVFNVIDRTSGPVICSYMTGWGSQGRESEETIVNRSTDLASGCFSFSSTWCRSLLLSYSTCYLGILGLEGPYWLEPPTKGQPLKRGQKLCSQSVLYSEVPLYYLMIMFIWLLQHRFPGSLFACCM